MVNNQNFITDVLDRATILSVVLISILVSLLSLSIPVAAQTLINLIAFGKLLQPVVTLSIILLITLLALGGLYIWQMIIIEVIQQKLMVKISHSLTHQYTHISLDNFSIHHGPELINRYFEVVTIKKSIAGILLYGINLALQLLFGLLLLVFYHPMFIAFDAFILTGLFLIIVIPYRKALVTAQQECTEKHQIGAWLEEILINRFLFRFNDYQRYATEQSDIHLVAFLKARNRHFKQLLIHQSGFYFLSAISSSLLLGIGGYLVIQNQLSLGQLVAAEIVIGGLMYSFARLGMLLEKYYELISAQDKVQSVLTLPIDPVKKDFLHYLLPMEQIKIKVKGEVEGIAAVNQPLVVFSQHPDSCQDFVNNFLGFTDNLSVEVSLNGTSISSLSSRVALRQYTQFIGKPQWFSGSIQDNLILNQRQISIKTILAYLQKVGLLEKVMNQPEGLETIIYDWQTVFTEFELQQLMVVRALMSKPQLLIIDRAFDFLDKDYSHLISLILEQEEMLLIFVTQQADFNALTNKMVLPE